jgi:hypothetical protein
MTWDKFTSANVWLPNSDGIDQSAKVKQRKRDQDGRHIGYRHKNPILDTSLYEFEFDDGRTDVYSANSIAQNVYEQVDDEGQ